MGAIDNSNSLGFFFVFFLSLRGFWNVYFWDAPQGPALQLFSIPHEYLWVTQIAFYHQTGQLYNGPYHLSHSLVLHWHAASIIFTSSSPASIKMKRHKRPTIFFSGLEAANSRAFDSEYIRLMPTKSLGLIFFLSQYRVKDGEKVTWPF